LTRPDISACVSHLSTFSQDPSPRHVDAAKKVFRYLASTISHGLRIDKRIPSGPILHCYADASHKRIGVDKATCSYVITLFGTPIDWCSYRMPTVATSVFAAELDALFNGAQEINFTRNLLRELSISPGPATPTLTDNTTVISFATHEGLTDKGRLIDHKYHRIRELVADGTISVSYIPSIENPADLLTKPVNRTRVILLRDRMHVQS
jgi:hypothetical protein